MDNLVESNSNFKGATVVLDRGIVRRPQAVGVVVVEADTGRRVASLAAAVGVDTVVAFTSTAIWLVFIGQVT